MNHQQFKKGIKENIDKMKETLDTLHIQLKDLEQNLMSISDNIDEIASAKVSLIYLLGRLNEMAPGCIDTKKRRINRQLILVQKGEKTDG